MTARRYRGSVTIAGQRHRKEFASDLERREWLKIMRLRKIRVEAGELPDPTASQAVKYAQLIPLLQQHYESGAERVHTPATLVNYRSQLRRLLAYWGQRTVAHTRAKDVAAWVAALRGEGLSTSGIRHLLDRLSAVHQLAVRHEHLSRLPCEVRRPKAVDLSPRQPVPDEEFSEVLKRARLQFDRRVELINLLARDAGLRLGDMKILRGEDVLENGFLYVRVRGEAEDRPKAPRGRFVPVLTDRLKDALASFPRVPGRSLLGVKDSQSIRNLAGKAWTGPAPLHRLRHGFVTTALAAGFPIPLVAAWVGHNDWKTTQRYSHPTVDSVPQEARQRFQKAVQGPVLPVIPEGTPEAKALQQLTGEAG